jgi:hypothetical protein
MAIDEGSWPNEAGFDTTYEENEPVELIVKGSIPYIQHLKQKIDFDFQIAPAPLATRLRLMMARYGQLNTGLMGFRASTVSRSI